MPLMNLFIKFIYIFSVLLACSQSFIIANIAIAGSIWYTMTDTKLQLPVVSLSTEENALLSHKLNSAITSS